MQILSASEKTVSIGSGTANAAISFENMTASAVAVQVETKNGRFTGLGFSSYGRYGHGGLLRERFIPRLRAAQDKELLDDNGTFDPEKAWAVLMKDEKEGGHGERSGAVGVLEMALWDAFAKSQDMPVWGLLAETFGHIDDSGPAVGKCPIYASGGHYLLSSDDARGVADEAKRSFDNGYAYFKLKVGGAPESTDLARIHAAIEVAGSPSLVAVDANGMLGGEGSSGRLEALDRCGLGWIEEPVAPLDFNGLAGCAGSLDTSIATGENIFSEADAANLLLFGGLRAGKDKLQMDPLLSYGVIEYMRMIQFAESRGWSRRDFHPHAGHQMALHMVAGLGLGSHETASVHGGPFSGVDEGTRIENGIAIVNDAPGLGIEYKPSLYRYFDGLLAG